MKRHRTVRHASAAAALTALHVAMLLFAEIVTLHVMVTAIVVLHEVTHSVREDRRERRERQALQVA